MTVRCHRLCALDEKQLSIQRRVYVDCLYHLDNHQPNLGQIYNLNNVTEISCNHFERHNYYQIFTAPVLGVHNKCPY